MAGSATGMAEETAALARRAVMMENFMVKDEE
jgi:hypothetical protein